MKIRVYAWIEFVIWILIIAIAVFGFKYYQVKNQNNFKSYQIFLDDIDGLIIGSPVKFLGIQVGHVKNIKIISSEVYVKFIITQKGLVLPEGVVATVEGSGLGGSKALEIYPPDKLNPQDKLIVSKTPTRLGKVMTLFKGIFKELDSILSTINNASEELSDDSVQIREVKEIQDVNKILDGVDSSINSVQQCEKDFKRKFIGDKKNDNYIKSKQN